MTSLLRLPARPGRLRALVVDYPLARPDYQRLRAISSRARHALAIVTLTTPLAMLARGRGPRRLEPAEIARVRVMISDGYTRRRFATLTMPNTLPSPVATACKIARLLQTA